MKISFNAQYLAGVADSDGSFTFGRKFNKNLNRSYFATQFQLTWKYSQRTKDFMEAFVKKYGGSFFIGYSSSSYKKGGIPIVKYCITGNACSRLCEEILPFLILKKEQAIVLIKGGNLKSNKWGVKGKPKSIWKEEERLYRLAKTLKL